jgi:hypothetical protein
MASNNVTQGRSVVNKSRDFVRGQPNLKSKPN